MKERKGRFRRVIIYGLVAGILGSGVILLVGSRLCAPAPALVTMPVGFPAQLVQTESTSGALLKGWLLEPPVCRGVVVLLHGVRSTRLALLERARFLAESGLAVVMFDFQAHGESPGKRITFGYLESRDAMAAVAFAKRRFPEKPVGVIGVSMGGAAALLANPALEVQALVLESVFPTITEAVQDRIEMVAGPYMRWLSPVLTLQLKPRIGCGPGDLCPVMGAARSRVPKLFIAGDQDRHTKIAESRELHRRAAEPKEFWEVAGAAHIDVHGYCRSDYEKRVLEFFAKHLR